MSLLDPGLLKRLERLSLVARHVRAGQTQGERRSTKRGTSVEFADYRGYTRGDDLRRVDWNVYARLERPFVKLFEEEEDLAVHLLLDGSGSMDWGGEEAGGREDAENKWLYARRLAGALGTVALTAGDRLAVTVIHPSPLAPRPSPLTRFGPVRGRGHILRLLEWLERPTAEGTTDLNGSLRVFALSGGRAGLVVLLSDLFSPTGYVEGLTALAARGHEVALLHLLAPDEVDPPLGGDLRLVDVETGDSQEVTIDGGMHSLYRRRLSAWREEIAATCRARGVHYVPIETDAPFEQVVLTKLRKVGLVR
jgi:uncharacterized protein (DUF58 family)